MKVLLQYLQIQPVWEVQGEDGRSLRTVVLPEEIWQTHFHDIPALQERVLDLENERTAALQKEVSGAEQGNEGEEVCRE